MNANSRGKQSTISTILVWMLCALYLLFSVGVVKATHFCMGREASVSFFSTEAKKCPCSLFAKEKDDCCDDKHDLLRLDDFQKNLPAFSISLPALTLLGGLYDVLSAIAAENPALLRPSGSNAQRPPKILFKIHCSYVFYDEKSVA